MLSSFVKYTNFTAMHGSLLPKSHSSPHLAANTLLLECGAPPSQGSPSWCSQTCQMLEMGHSFSHDCVTLSCAVDCPKRGESSLLASRSLKHQPSTAHTPNFINSIVKTLSECLFLHGDETSSNHSSYCHPHSSTKDSSPQSQPLGAALLYSHSHPIPSSRRLP